MKISENWLRERVSIPVDREDLIERLDMIGHEVEEAVTEGETLDGIVVAHIRSCRPHPDSTHMQICEVEHGSGDVLQIVCGAANARAGLKAPLARVGAVVGGQPIAAVELRGVESVGMLCSAAELGLDGAGPGLMELPPDAPAGTPLAEYLGLPDSVLDLGLTPNRADCLSLEGLAADVAAAFGQPHRFPDPAPVPAQTDRAIAIELESPADCPRYCGRYIEGVDRSAPSPLWMRERLRRAGLRPHNLLVDVTNYVMLELGQPLHAFDAARLTGPIAVRRARAGEMLRLLDEREVKLDESFLLVTDADRPVALAGLMGGWDTRVEDTTADVFLEAAHFAPAALAGRARRLGMHTDAAHRFERGVDPELPRQALERATQLILEHAGGRPGPLLEAVSSANLPVRAPVRLRRARLARILGIEVPDADVERILTQLGFAVSATSEGWTAVPPSRRFDISIEEDLIEEVARIHGYDRIPATAPGGRLETPSLPETQVSERALRAQLASRDWHEAITFAFVPATLLERWGAEEGSIALANPLSADLGVMRTSLLPGLVEALRANRARQRERVRLFELGRSYHRDGDGAIREVARVAGVACGTATAEQWAQPERALDFFDLKGDLESLLALGGAAPRWRFSPGGADWLHPGQAAWLERDGQRIGSLGALHPRLRQALDLDDEVFAFELELAPLRERAVPVARPLSRYPSVRRDLSIEVPEAVSFAEVEAALQGAVGDLLKRVVLFDRYQGQGLGEGVYSLAMGLILQDVSRTLTDGEADRCMAQAVAAVETSCKARLRG